MAYRPETSLEGSLYELVARGQKDKFFFKDDEKSIQPFDYRYQAYPAILPEVRQTIPITDCKFGNTTEFLFDFAGDLLVEANLLIDLPSWLPPEFSALNGKSVIQDLSGIRYGYTNGIAYFAFKKIEIFQDQFLLQEISGDALYALSRTRGSFNGQFLDNSFSGIHDGTNISIQRNATPGRLVLKLPFPGCQQGDSGYFPLSAVRAHNYRLRITLRNIQELVEATDGGMYPEPWGKMFQIVKRAGAEPIQFRSIDLIKLAKPVIYIETRQLYISNELRKKLSSEDHVMCFRRYYENIFTFGEKDYAPLDKQAQALVTRIVDAQFLAERMIHFFRVNTVFRTNQLYNFQNSTSPDNQFYDSLKLVIAGQDREGPWAPFVWTDLIQHSKEERACSIPITTMNWGYGWRQEDDVPAGKQPVGGLNFTTAVRPQLNISLLNISQDTVLKQRISEFRTIVESWAVYEIKDGRARFKFEN